MQSTKIDKHPTTADFVSLHANPVNQNHDNDINKSLQFAPPAYDLLPLYNNRSDVAANNASSSDVPLVPIPGNSPAPSAEIPVPFSVNKINGTESYIDERLNTSPEFLQSHIERWAAIPPRPYVSIKGTHESRRSDGSNDTITDFDVRVELTPYLVPDGQTRQSWNSFRTVENWEITARGTVSRQAAPGYQQGGELPDQEKQSKPTLEEWCHRYCSSYAALKVFKLRREITGFDYAGVTEALEALVRQTKYTDTVSITFPVHGEFVEVFNDSKVNKLRRTLGLQWFFLLTFLWIFAWPYLYFRTKRFEVAVATWAFSKPAQGGNGDREFITLNESQWFDIWSRAIYKAVSEKKSVTLDHGNLAAATGVELSVNTVYPAVGGAFDFTRANVNTAKHAN